MSRQSLEAGALRGRCVGALLCLWLAASAAIPSWAQGESGPGSVREQLERARTISYTDHWQKAQAILDELAPRLDEFDLRDFASFHLQEARHLVLDDRSPEALERLRMLLDKPLEDDQRLRALQLAAHAGVVLRDYETAFDKLMAALEIEPRVDDPVAGISTFNMATHLFGRVGQHERAIDYGKEAVSRALRAADTSQECTARQRIASVYAWAEQPEESEAQYRLGIDACRSAGNELFVGALQAGLADLVRSQGRLAEAKTLAESAIATMEEAAYPLGVYEARLVLAATVHDLGLIDPEARAGFEEIADYFRTNGLWDQVARIELLQARVAEEHGESDSAAEHYRHHIEARDQFIDRDRAMRLAYLELEFDTRFKERQIDLLEENARLAQVEATTANEQRRLRTIILLLSIFVAVLLAFLLFNAFRGRRHFRHLSRHDALSGLANQGWFLERAGSMLVEAEREGASPYLVMADIDHFKKINDAFGHLYGYQVLGLVARRLRDAFGTGALIGRVGGEEFAILIVAHRLDPVIEGIKAFQEAPAESVRDGDPSVTLSFGIGRYRAGESLETLRKRTDAALYQAKREGRDRYVVSPEARDDADDSSALQPT